MKNSAQEDDPCFDIFSYPLPKGVNCLKRNGVQTVDDLMNKHNLDDVIAILEASAGSREKEQEENSLYTKNIILFHVESDEKQG